MSPAPWSSRPLAWFELRWPREVEMAQVAAALLAINGLSTPRRREPIVLRASGSNGTVRHHVAIAEDRQHLLGEQLRSALPGLGLTPLPASDPYRLDRGWRAWVSTNRKPLNSAVAPTSSVALLTALSTAGPNELLLVEVLLGPVRRPTFVPTRPTGHFEDAAVLTAPFTAPAASDPATRRALAAKQATPGWRVCLRLGVQARGRRRQRQLLGRAAAAVRTLQAPGVQVGFGGVAAATVAHSRRPLRWPLALNVNELVGVTAWPIGKTEHLPVTTIRSRSLPPVKEVPASGRVVGRASAPGRDRLLALPIEQARQHLWLVGATGTGKTTLALNLLARDMADGRSVVVVEPRGDLIAQVLERVPPHRLDEVVLLDPGDSAPVGINPLADRRLRAEIIVDSFVHLFKELAGDNLGPRSEDILTNGLLTLARQPEPYTLVHLPALLTDAAFRRHLVRRAPDPLGTDGFWSWFENLGSAERAAVLAPILNKLRRLVVREPVRRILGQARPRFDVGDIFSQRRIVLLNLNEGTLGSESAALVGAVFLTQLWQATQRRAAVDPVRRHVVPVVLDEWQRFVRLPGDLADVLTQARGLGLALTLANQHAGQLPPSVRAAVMANARSRVVFGTSFDEAQALVRQDDRLSPADVVGLGHFEAFASLMTSEGPSPYMSVRTLPPAAPTSDAREARRRSRERFGIAAADIDTELLAAVDAATAAPDEGFGRRRRPNGEEG